MRLTIKDVNKFLESFDNFLSHPMHIGLIGAAALLYDNIRPSTKDIDIVFFTIEDIRESTDFLNNYSRENRVEIQSGFGGRFQSLLINEDMFKHSKKMSRLRESFLHTYKFKNLHIHLLIPVYFVLVKIEAAVKERKHFEDAMKIVKHFKIPKEKLIEVYNEYRPEIEMIPRVETEFNIFMKDVYFDKNFNIKNYK